LEQDRVSGGSEVGLQLLVELLQSFADVSVDDMSRPGVLHRDVRCAVNGRKSGREVGRCRGRGAVAGDRAAPCVRGFAFLLGFALAAATGEERYRYKWDE